MSKTEDSPATEAAPPEPPAEKPAEESRSKRFLSAIPPDKRFLILLIVLALATRFIWIFVIHEPWEYVFSDMKKYVVRAQFLAEHGFVWGERTLAWQSFGTHYLLAIPLKIFGPKNLGSGAALWALMGAGAVPLTYLVACRVVSHHKIAMAAGGVALFWHPHLSNSAYFLSETPFLFFLLLSTYSLLRTLQEGKGAVIAGLASAVAFALRPQAAAFFVLVFVVWLVNVRRLKHVRVLHLVVIAIPLLSMLSFSLWRFEKHTGQWAGVAETANMNLTAGRCHNIVTQAFRNSWQLRRSERRRKTNDGRRVSLPGFRQLSRAVPPSHPLALRPAMRSETIRFVGYIGDAEIHKGIREECYRRTGVVEQARYSVVNMMLLWFVGHQWPENEKGRKIFFPPIVAYKHIYQVLFWLPSTLGMFWGLAWIRRRPSMAIVAAQLLASMVIAAIFFGTIRIRIPYDPYAFILGLQVWWTVGSWAVRRYKSRRSKPPAGRSSEAPPEPKPDAAAAQADADTN